MSLADNPAAAEAALQAEAVGVDEQDTLVLEEGGEDEGDD